MFFKNIAAVLLVLSIFFGCVSKQKDMAKMSLEYREHVISQKSEKIRGYNLKYTEKGEGEVFLLVHGIPTSSWMYRKLVDRLSKKYRVIAPDLIGFGQSSKPNKDLNITKHAEILTDFLDTLKISEFNLMMHDFGGPITLKALGTDKFKVKKAIILDTFIFEEGWNNGCNFFSKAANNILPKIMPETFFEMGIKAMFTDKPSADVVDGYVRPLKDKNGSRGYSCLYSSIPDIVENNLAEIQKTFKKYFNDSNTKIIWGKNDPFIDSKKQVDQMAQFIELGKDNVHILKTGTHLIADENADQIMSIIN